ncbi:LlaJI family restriction endonuclease [Colwellia sp. MB3u-4]|uniref:LlaJI family restriction endonuclease n=1 Tax=Colwellia sp. MB3u-4 TaxID=2759822 RepID=UPI0015F771C2|nr:LlaJI family restriction endonuclease [Colwellia sp. MB3u-4]MBA6289484.1 LlaJI family restriction endonuclease [Colwellia sp. MB3u-4]
MLAFKLLEDRGTVSGLDDNTIASFQRLGLIVKKNKIERIHFCGAVVINRNVFIFLPRNSLSAKRLQSYNTHQIASLIIHTLNKYHTLSANILSSNYQAEDGAEGLSTLSSIIWLLNDYVTYGLYTTQKRYRNINSGKINWKRTISKETPFLNDDNVPVYLRLHSERLRFGESSIISMIHSEIIQTLDLNFSWLITGDPSIRMALDLNNFVSTYDDQTKIHFLKSELNNIYADRDIKLIQALILYLEQRMEAKEGEILIGVKFFENVWEEMLRATIPYVRDVNELLPKPAYYLKNEIKPSLGRGMLTDIVSILDKRISLIDAKYYKAETINDSPRWSDLVKQFFYAKALKQVFPNYSIANWFIFPGGVPKIDEGPISKVAVINMKDHTPIADEFPPIGCSYFCPIDVMVRYKDSNKFQLKEIDILFNQV